MAHNRNTPSEGRPDLNFAVVEAEVSRISNRYRERVGALLALGADEAEHATSLLDSRFAEVELAGVTAFNRLRRMQGDNAQFEWKSYVRGKMLKKLEELFDIPDEDEDEDEGEGGAPARAPRGPDRPTSGSSTGERREYLANREDLALVAQRMATAHAHRIIGSWSGGSEDLDDVKQAATIKGMDRCERRWDPSMGPLLAYLSMSVMSVVRSEYRTMCEQKERDSKLAAEFQHRREEDVDIETAADQDRREREDQVRLIWFAQLSDAQREEVRRRHHEGTAGSNAQQNRYSRALKKLESMLEEPAKPAAAFAA